jgi:hypothetical protein
LQSYLVNCHQTKGGYCGHRKATEDVDADQKVEHTEPYVEVKGFKLLAKVADGQETQQCEDHHARKADLPSKPVFRLQRGLTAAV